MEEKVEAIVDDLEPVDVRQLRSLLGIVPYYHKFLLNLATVLQPLHQLLHTGQKWTWEQKDEAAFKHVKEAVTSKTVLAHFDP